MATATITLPITKSGYVKELEPTIVFPTDSDSEYKLTRDFVGRTGYKNGLCFGFSSFPDRLKYARIYNIAITLQLKSNVTSIASTDPIADFDPETLTYANRGQAATNNAPYFSVVSQNYSDVTSGFSFLPTASDISSISVKYLRAQAFIVQNIGSDQTDTVYGKTLLTGSGDPYITVTYDDDVVVSDAVVITKAIGADSIGSFNATVPQTVAWDIVRNDSDVYYCFAESFEQESAVFFYRKQGDTAWNQIAVNSSAKSLVIPANTFTTDPDTSYEYYIQATDVLGNVLTSGTATCRARQNIIVTLHDSGQSPYWYYFNPHTPLTFYWQVYTVGTLPGQTDEREIGNSGNTTIEWRVYGGESHTIQVPDFGASQYTVPADTFPAVDIIQYKIYGTDSTGYQCVASDSWLRFKTAAGPITSVAVSPINSVQKSNQPIQFVWQFTSDDGNPPSRYELVWRPYGDTTWNTLVDSTEIATEYTAAAGLFPVGQIEWAVIPYNLDSIVGNYTINSFIAYGAPEAPLVNATAAPFTVISWQSDGQQAFEVEINGTAYGPYFGEDKQFEPPDKLDDGEYTIRVRVAGTYYLWSEWGETSITVENVTEYGVYLSGNDSIDAHLEWETDAETGDFYIYRDGILIARTLDYEFDDRLANGEHVYQVLNRLPDGNYCISLEVSAGSIGKGTFITAADAKDPWISLQYSTESNHDIQYTDSAVTVFANYSGDSYPHGFTSIYRESQMSLTAAFKDSQKVLMERFEALLGRPVIVKHNRNPVFVGIINTWTKLDPQWKWKSYSCSIQRIEWEDFVDGTTGNNSI